MNILSAPKRLSCALRDDIAGYDRHNADEAKVLAAHFFSSYKGVPVLRICGKRSGALVAIFLTRKNANTDTVRHEYGHILQLRRLGFVKYAVCIFLPSWRRWGNDKYYDKPWEITADLLGGARTERRDPVNVRAGRDYLEKRANMKLSACLRANRELKRGGKI